MDGMGSKVDDSISKGGTSAPYQLDKGRNNGRIGGRREGRKECPADEKDLTGQLTCREMEMG